jgi:Transposase DNA-binding/Transposase DDE domain
VATDGSVVDELASGTLGDRRLDERRDRVVAAVERHPDRGFPDACETEAESEALYRFLRNPRVTSEAVIEPHVVATAARCAAAGEVLVIHDTTDMAFPGAAPRQGLTPLGPGRQGFWVHASLAVSADGRRAPLGVVALQSYARPRTPRRWPTNRARFTAPTKESRRWLDGVRATRTRLAATPVIHLMDREADSYELLAALIEAGERFVIRATYDRTLIPTADTPACRFSEALASATVVYQRKVAVATRGDRGRTRSARTRHPARVGRIATLQVATQPMHLRRSALMTTGAPMLAVHVVWVHDIEAQPGVEPVDWRLVTTEPIGTRAQILRIVDWYRARWLIEEHFKALKTGCAYEKRQLESLQTLRVALALLAPIAWRLLHLRHLARVHPARAATTVLTPRQLQVLRASSSGVRLTPVATVTDALAAVARLGGHLTHNGPPGWLVLTRGLIKLRDMELG